MCGVSDETFSEERSARHVQLVHLMTTVYSTEPYIVNSWTAAVTDTCLAYSGNHTCRAKKNRILCLFDSMVLPFEVSCFSLKETFRTRPY